MGEKMLNKEQVAEKLGVSVTTVKSWAYAGKIPSFKLGVALRFKLSEIDAWIETKRNPAAL